MTQVNQVPASVKALKVGAAKRHLLERLALLRQAKRLRTVRFAPLNQHARHTDKINQLSWLRSKARDKDKDKRASLVAELNKITGKNYQLRNNDGYLYVALKESDPRGESLSWILNNLIRMQHSNLRDFNGKHYEETAVEALENFISDELNGEETDAPLNLKSVIVEAVDHNVILAWFVDVADVKFDGADSFNGEFERRLDWHGVEEVETMPFAVTYSTPKQNRVVQDRDEDIEKTEAKFELADDGGETTHNEFGDVVSKGPSEQNKLRDRLEKLYELKYNAAPYRGLLDPVTFEPTEELPKLPADQAAATAQRWIDRPLPPLDALLGDAVIATDIKLMIAGAKGIGKTTFAIAIGMRASLGLPFLHLRKGGVCRVLYVDADMGRRQLKDRLVAEAKRIGKTSDTFFAMSHEDVGVLLQLDTSVEARQAVEDWIEEKIGGKVDLIIFDNIASLVEGDLLTGHAWKTLMPWVRSLTERKIGQVWIHHAGHNTKRFYGSDTTSWGIDAVLHLDHIDRPDSDVSFEMHFDEKARERKPNNRDQFASAKIALVNDKWIGNAEAASEPKKRTQLSSMEKKFFDVLGALGTVAAPDALTKALIAASLLDTNERGALTDIARKLLSRHRKALIDKGWITVDQDGYVAINTDESYN
jgi:hypothetical protein